MRSNTANVNDMNSLIAGPSMETDGSVAWPSGRDNRLDRGNG